MDHFDRVDGDLAGHIRVFIDELPQRIGLDRILNLECDDPAETLELLREIHSAVHEERRKALLLYHLSRDTIVAQVDELISEH